MKTELQVRNVTTLPITVWLTLGAVPGCLQDVSLVPWIQNVLNPLVGSFVLDAGDSVNPYAPDGLGFDGNLSFGTQPLNCPTAEFPNGVNIFEFIINNEFQSGTPQETVDISCVAGVNCTLMASLGGKNWNAGVTQPRVRTIGNGESGSNTGRIGVYPIGCDICTGSQNPPSCPNPPTYENPQAAAICNVQRDAVNQGGLVIVDYWGPLV